MGCPILDGKGTSKCLRVEVEAMERKVGEVGGIQKVARMEGGALSR